MSDSMVSMEVEIDLQSLAQVIQAGKDATKDVVKLYALELWGNVKRESPVDEGRLASSFQIDAIDDLSWRVSSNVLYAMFVQSGTGIFGPSATPIVPVSASALVFEIGGEMVFARSVLGMKPNPYLDRAMDRTSQRLNDLAAVALEKV